MNVSQMIDLNENNLVNNIPSAYYFKRLCGRTGPFCMKRRNANIDAIYDALKTIQSIRHVITVPTIARLRHVRIACAAFTNDFGFSSKSPKDVATVNQLVEALDDRIDLIATVFMGNNKQTNIDEINERIFEGFYTDVAARPVWGPGRKLNNHYYEERATERHVPHSLTSEWLASKTKMGLNDWLDTIYKWKREDGTNLLNEDFTVNGVKYMDANERANYIVNFRAGEAKDSQGEVVHTGNLRSITNGRGWGIFVMNFAREIYLGEHTVGEFHHSSFMSGAPVLAAGEIAINNGVVVGLTNKTGHYKAKEEELVTMLTELSTKQVNIARIGVQDPFRRPQKWFTGTDALGVNGRLIELADDAEIPKPNVP